MIDIAGMRRAFTLIELLIVIAIIAILAAILFPVFAQAREKARSAACISNLKQLGIAFAQYEQDYDEVCPLGTDGWGYGAGWAGTIYPYIKSDKVFLCLDDSLAADVCSYGYNMNLVPGVNCNNGLKPKAMQISQFASPARSVLLFEVIGNQYAGYTSVTQDAFSATCSAGTWWSPSGNGYWGRPAGGGSGGSSPTLQYNTGYMRNAAQQIAAQGQSDPALSVEFFSQEGPHQGGANFLLADNHAKWLKPTAVGVGNDNTTAGDCQTTSTNLAPNTSCADPTLAATFSVH